MITGVTGLKAKETKDTIVAVVTVSQVIFAYLLDFYFQFRVLFFFSVYLFLFYCRTKSILCFICNMAKYCMRPGGLSDDEESDDDLLIEYNESFGEQSYSDGNAATPQSQVWKVEISVGVLTSMLYIITETI